MQRLWSITKIGLSSVVDAVAGGLHAGSSVAFDADGGDLELGHLRQGVDGADGELVGGLVAGPVVGDEHGVGPDGGDHRGGQGDLAAAGPTVTWSPSAMPRESARRGWISHSGSGYWSTRLAMRRVWVPDRYWLTTRPVVSHTG
jgi:hypothetical protein